MYILHISIDIYIYINQLNCAQPHVSACTAEVVRKQDCAQQPRLCAAEVVRKQDGAQT